MDVRKSKRLIAYKSSSILLFRSNFGKTLTGMVKKPCLALSQNTFLAQIAIHIFDMLFFVFY